MHFQDNQAPLSHLWTYRVMSSSPINDNVEIKILKNMFTLWKKEVFIMGVLKGKMMSVGALK